MFIREDFPAPDGPMIAVNLPDFMCVEIPLRIVLYPDKKNLFYSKG